MVPRTGPPPAGPQWVHELKWDGYRIQAHVSAGRVRLYSRNGADYTERLGDLAAQFRPLRNCIIDGEAVLLGPDGRPDFIGLHRSIARRRPQGLVFMTFDLMRFGDRDVRSDTLLLRRVALRELLAGSDGPRIQFVEFMEEDGPVVLRAACRFGLEGIVSKRITSRYVGGPSRAWIKSKCPQWLARFADRADSFR